MSIQLWVLGHIIKVAQLLSQSIRVHTVADRRLIELFKYLHNTIYSLHFFFARLSAKRKIFFSKIKFEKFEIFFWDPYQVVVTRWSLHTHHKNKIFNFWSIFHIDTAERVVLYELLRNFFLTSIIKFSVASSSLLNRHYGL